MSLPGSGSQYELWRNWGDIVWHGANGELVEPLPTAEYCAEAIVKMSGDHNEWRVADVPAALKRWLKLADYCEYESLTCFPNSESPGGDEVGWLVALGQTSEEAIRTLNARADMLPDGLDANTECVAYVLKEIHEMEKVGIKFGEGIMPQPSVVMTS